MTETLKITAQKRDESKNPRQLRAEGFLPATLYGKGMDSLSIQLNTHEFLQSVKKNPEPVCELKVDSKAYKAVIQNIQTNYSTMEKLNVEFKVV